jgi:transglutaminase-like putative cysteine protease
MAPPAPARPAAPRFRWVSALAGGIAVLLAGSCMVAVVQGGQWIADVALAVAVVVGLGIALQRLPGAVVVLAQLAGLLVTLSARFGEGLLPGSGTFAAFGDHLREAGGQIDSGIAPVVPTPGMLFLITAAFGLLAVAVHAISVSADAPAAGGVPLLCAVAVPAALSPELLPWWTMALAAAGFGLLLVARDGAFHRGSALVTGGIAVVAVAGVLGLALGGAATLVGTQGRFATGGSGGSGGGAIGLNPFTSLRGQLTQSDPVELFRTTGLPRPTYLRALTLSDYDPATGWSAPTPRPGIPLAGPLTPDAPQGDPLQVTVENVGFRDYWLPVYGQPGAVSGVDVDRWAYDQSSGIAYSQRPREEDGWTQTGVLPTPSAAQLRAAAGSVRVDPVYRDTRGVDQRVTQIAADATRGADTDFDKAVALVEYFTGPDSAFRYSLETAPGSGDDALVEFLTVGRVGYCEQYASAMAVMLRTQGVPARVAVGFTAGTEGDGYRSVSTRDAHAWVEAWFPGYGWTTFDPTPLTDGRTVVPPYVQEAVGDGAEGAAAEPVPADEVPVQEAPPTPEAPQVPVPQEVEQPAPVAEEGGFPIALPLVVLLVVALLAAPFAVRRLLHGRRVGAAAAGGAGAGRAAWDEVLATSQDHGGVPAPGDTVRSGARDLVRTHDLDADAQDSLREVVRLVEAEWYGDEPPAAGALTRPLDDVLGAVATSGRRGWAARLLPRSLLTLVQRPKVPTA